MDWISDLRPYAVRLGFELGRPDLVALAAFAIAIAAALIIHRLLHSIVAAGFNQNLEALRLLKRVRGPTRMVLIAVAITITLPIATFEPNIVAFMRRVLAVTIIVFAGWSVIAAIITWGESVERRFKVDVEDNLIARKHLTQMRLLRRTAIFVTALFTFAAILMTFPGVRDLGVSLFASAGVAGIVAAFAARPVLSNLIAGLQIAFEQPIRIDDVVIVEGEWGWVEEITATYVVIRIWDWRRLIVPLSYFIEKPFENWTRESASIIGSVLWHLDYTAPVAEMRAKLDEFLGETRLWDGNISNLQVTEAGAETITVRALMSARTSPKAWDLRCEVREKMIAWLRDHHPHALPRRRAQLLDADGAGRLDPRVLVAEKRGSAAAARRETAEPQPAGH